MARSWRGRGNERDARARTVVVLAVAVAVLGAPGAAGAQGGPDATEAVMVAAGEWALDRLPAGPTRLDPHRTGAGRDEARVRRVARALGAELGTLEDTRRCADVMDPSTCALSARLLAIGAPRIDGSRARVRVYGWWPSDAPRSPVSQQSWDLVLERSSGGWSVVGVEGG